MTKAEKSRLDIAERELRIARALRWADYTPFLIDNRIADNLEYKTVVPAFWFSTHTRSVGEGCFNSYSHSYVRTDKTESQNIGGPWFAARKDALRALRTALARQYAEWLAELDEEIAGE